MAICILFDYIIALFSLKLNRGLTSSCYFLENLLWALTSKKPFDYVMMVLNYLHHTFVNDINLFAEG